MAFFWLFASLTGALAAEVSHIEGAGGTGVGTSRPLEPGEALKAFHLHPECQIELVVAEPNVIDPVHIAFDSRGRLWVVEYSDYPNGPQEGEPGRSRIRVLTDTDGDGQFEQPTLFAEGLTFATGLLHWRDGVIVTTGTSVLFLRDTDGDLKVDETQEWFRGFKAENPQLRANHPTLGIDNKVYIASGLRGGDVGPGADWSRAFQQQQSMKSRDDAATKLPDPVSLSGRDFRFDPLTGEFEAVSGPGQFGLAFDDWGNRFVCDNRHPCKQIMLEDRVLRRNPDLRIAATFHDVSAQGEQSRLYPLSRAWTTSNLHAHQFTAACGLCLYRGSALPDAFYENAFVCDPTANLVHRDVLTPRGGTFDSQPGRAGVEFLASPDEWFRPVNLTVGPDGALYVVDMYRAVIEHPQFMPDELKTRPDLLLGTDRGRIWRVIARTTVESAADQGASGRRLESTLPEVGDGAGWCARLESPNGWQRETAHRLLLESSEPIGPALEEIARRSVSPQARAHAIWLLDAKRELSDEFRLELLFDGDTRVQRQGVRLLAGLADGFGEKWQQYLTSRMVQLARQSPDESLLLELALTLSEFPGEQSASALAVLLNRQTSAGWISDAVATAPWPIVLQTLRQRSVRISAVSPNAAPAGTAMTVVRETHLAGEGPWSRLYELAGLRGTDAELSEIVERTSNDAEVAAIASGVRRRGKRLIDLLSELSEPAQVIISDWILQSHRTARDSAAGITPARLAAIEGLYHDRSEVVVPVLLDLSGLAHPPEVRVVAIEGLAAFSTVDLGDQLLTQFTSEPPLVRSAIVRAMTAATSRTNLLLDRVAAGEIPPALIDTATANRLKGSREPEIRDRAVKLLAAQTPAARQEVLAKYQSCLTLAADPLRGRAVFQKNCIACHKIGDLGVDVAPDISDSRTKTADYLLTHILDPNRAIDNNYFSYTVVDTTGRSLSGVIASETATSITLKQPEGKVTVLLRSEIELLQASGVSLMPEGLEKNITPEQMADLISFIKNWRYLDGAVPKEVIR